ncbi:MAG: UDP-N-acetylglucosamine 4,6-dehydratase (inverting) [Chlamydiae bacterium]|nr:UDP-N-acetylglucosamine 4,6-dehydratase (inverting) [Chlamydiota bacterium]
MGFFQHKVITMNLYQNFSGKTILITGGTGSFGQAFIKKVLLSSSPKKIIVFSRDEWKQSQMCEEDPVFNHPSIRYFLGDIRDKERLKVAFREVDYLIHAAALKQVPAAEYNPSEFIKTNIIGTLNVMEAAIEEGIEKVMALSTDKAVRPINLYGATKLCGEKLILSASAYVGNRNSPTFAVVRYGNVLGSKGSLIPKWQRKIKNGAKSLQVTDLRMTRFWMTLNHAVDFVVQSLFLSKGGEIYVPKISSMKIVDLAKALAPDLAIETCGIRPGEKLHEHLITKEEASITEEFSNHYVLRRAKAREDLISNVSQDFEYVSNENSNWITKEELLNELNPRVSEKLLY